MRLAPALASVLTCAALARLLYVAAAFRAAARRKRDAPTLILLLGGCALLTSVCPRGPGLTLLRSDLARERAAAQLVSGRQPPPAAHAALPWTSARVVLSSGASDARAFYAAGVASSRLLVDNSAVDTLTNVTTSLTHVRAALCTHVVVATSAYHAPRAAAVAHLVLGARGVATTVVPLSHAGEATQPRESALRVARDVVRAACWALTGMHGGEWACRLLHPERFRHLDAAKRRRWR